MKIGIISDTHNRLSSKIFTIFEGLPIIIHAGDIGEPEILLELKTIPGVQEVHAVLGNTDAPWELRGIPEALNLTVAHHAIFVRHILASPQILLKEFRQAKKEMPEMVIFGHTHQPYFQQVDSVYFLNPGSATSPRKVPRPTVAILEWTSGPPKVEFIDL